MSGGRDTLARRTRLIGHGALFAAGVALVLMIVGLATGGSSSSEDAAEPAPRAQRAPAVRTPAPSPTPTPAPPVELPPVDQSKPAEPSLPPIQGGGRAAATTGFDPREIYEREAPGVVTILSVFAGTGGLSALLGGDQEEGLGSGFVLNERGEIATNAHVVTTGEGRATKRADEVYVEFADGNRVPAKIIGEDPNSDIAMLRIDPRGLDLDPLPLGRSGSVEVGEPVAAIGSPFGERQSLSVGVVSAIDRSIQSLTAFTIPGAIQTDAAINRGNSGGPLVNARGEVIGVNSQIRTTSGDGSGVGFAVPVDVARRVLSQIREDGKARYAYLGVSSQELYPQVAKQFKLPTDEGAWLAEVNPGGPGAKAGLKGGATRERRFQASTFRVGGDIITSVEGEPIRDSDDLGAVIARFKPGQKVTVELWRAERKQSVEVTLGERPVTGSRTPGG